MIEFHWVGCHETPTTAVRLCFHCDSDETVTVTLNGETKSASAVTTVNDGNVAIDFTGLTPDTVYPVDVVGYSGQYGIKARTWPTDSLRVIHASCISPGEPGLWAFKAIAQDAHLLIANDDFPYTNEAVSSAYVASAASIADSDGASFRADETNYAKHHRREMGKRGLQKLIATGINFLYMFGDHEWCFDDWDHSQADNLPGFASQADCDAAWNAGRKACESYMIGNPANTDPNVGDKYPRIIGGAITVNAPTTPASNYPAQYCRVGNEACEIFLCDTISHRSPLSAADNINKTMFGTDQKAWIEAQIPASTAAFKLWVHGKYLFPLAEEPASGDRFDKYSAERDDVLSNLDGTTCVITVAGDKHVPNIGVHESPDMCCICACPSGVIISDHNLSFGTDTQHIAATRNSDDAQVYGYGEFTKTGATMQMIRVRGNRPVWTGQFTPDGNLPTYPRARVA